MWDEIWYHQRKSDCCGLHWFSVAMQPAYTAAATASTRIRQKLDNLRVKETKCHIYRVYDHLRNLNPSAYEPQILAIGPYHHGKGNTKLMEKHKLHYLRSLLRDQSVDPYVSAIEEIKQEALSCYANSMEDSIEAEFTDIMLLDGCFIIELLQKYGDSSSTEAGDPIFETKWMLYSIQRDLMLFENQIPFIVLCKLLKLLEGYYPMLLDLILCFFKGMIPGAPCRMPPDTTMPNADDIKHLLHLIYTFWSPDSSASHQNPVDENPDSLDTSHQKLWQFVSAVKNLIWCPALLDKFYKKPGYSKSWPFVSAVTKLRDSYVKFEKNHDQETSLFNITFKNGTLKLPHLRIEDRTEALFRNLIAYEQYFSKQHNFATDYEVP